MGNKGRAIQKIAEAHHGPVAKFQGSDNKGTVCFILIIIKQMNGIAVMAVIYGQDIAILDKGKVTRRNPLTKEDYVAFRGGGSIFNGIHAVAQVKNIGVVARSAE